MRHRRFDRSFERNPATNYGVTSGIRLNRQRWRKRSESATMALAFCDLLAFHEQRLALLELSSPVWIKRASPRCHRSC